MIVESGTGEDADSARAAAYWNLLERISGDLGYDAAGMYYRELLSSDAVSELHASVTATYRAPEHGAVRYYAMMEIPSESYYQSASDEHTEAIERSGSISAYMDEARECYLRNEDTAALVNTLRALDLSFDGSSASSGYTSSEILSEAMRYLGNIRISVSGNSLDDIPEVRLRRARGIFYPPVVNASVLVTYPMVAGDGSIISSSITMMTDSDGSAEFIRTNPYMIREGEIRFSVAVPGDLLASVLSKAPAGFMDDFMSLLEDTSALCSYSYPERISSDSCAIGIAAYGSDGVQIGSDPVYAAFSDYLRAAGAEGYVVVPVIGDSDEEALLYLRRMIPLMDHYIILRAGIVDSRSGAGVSYVRTEGQLSIYDASSDEPLSVQNPSASEGGSDAAAAGEASLARCGAEAAGMLLSVL